MTENHHVIYLLLGGNLLDVEHTFKLATIQLETKVGEITQLSKLYKSEAWGFESENTFLNQVVRINSVLTPSELLSTIQKIEIELGRSRTIGISGFESRVIDIDILYYNKEVISINGLTIPHYALHERIFTLKPLAEIAPDFLHPILNKTNQSLLYECKDKSTVTIK